MRTALLLLAVLALLCGCSTPGSNIRDADYAPQFCDYDFGRMDCIWIAVDEGPPRTVQYYYQCQNCHDIIRVTYRL